MKHMPVEYVLPSQTEVTSRLALSKENGKTVRWTDRMGSGKLISQNVVWGSMANIPSTVLQITQKRTAEGAPPPSSCLASPLV